MKIILCSFYNSNNIGDKAISKAFYELYSKKYDVIRCGNDGSFNITGYYSEKKVNVIERIIRKICKKAGIRFYIKSEREFLKDFSTRLSTAEFVVVAGGNIMMEYIPNTKPFLIYQDYLRIAKAQKKKIAAVSIGIGPFSTKESLKLAINILNQFDYVSFRDRYSYELYIDNGGDSTHSTISIDPVISYFGGEKIIKTGEAIGINIINPKWKDKEYAYSVYKGYLRLIDVIRNKYPDSKIIVYSTEINDEISIDKLENELSKDSKIVFKKPREIDELVKMYNECKVIVGTRMHSLIIAFSNRIPIVGLCWEKKVSEFFNIIKKDRYAFDIDSFSCQVDDIINAIESINMSEWDYDVVFNSANYLLKRDVEELEKRKK